MPVSELDLASALFWVLGHKPSDVAGRELAARLRLGEARDQADLRAALLGTPEARQVFTERLGELAPSALDLERPRLVFLHFPKCGGTTLHAMLSEHFAPAVICPERHNGLQYFQMGELASYSLFSGHFDLESVRALPGRKTRIITMLREPCSRLVSLYHYLKVHRRGGEEVMTSVVTLAKSLSIEEFFSHPLVRRNASVCNAVTTALTRRLTSVRWEAIEGQLQPMDQALADPIAAAEQALTALESLTAVGILELFEESMTMFSTTLGLQLRAIPPQQVTGDLSARENFDFAERPEITEHLQTILLGLTVSDRILYARAKQLFRERFAQAERSASPVSWQAGPPEVVPLDAFEPREGRRDGSRIAASGRGGVLAIGPYMPLKHGHYRVACYFAIAGVGDTGAMAQSAVPGVVLNVWHNGGWGKCATVHWSGASPAVAQFTLPFDVADVEFVIEVEPGIPFELLAVELAVCQPGVSPS